jgi:nucleoside-diphosphate-sugar epimerase
MAAKVPLAGSEPVTLVTGGCGFVGRHLVRRLLAQRRSVLIVDDLSTGIHPDRWLGSDHQGRPWSRTEQGGVTVYRSDGQQVVFAARDLIAWLLFDWPTFERSQVGFDYVFHLASVVGGRAKIDGDPMAVAIDLAIDSVFFRWAVRNRARIGRVLYASSSAAYPVQFQGAEGAVALSEDMVAFGGNLGQPDMTYGWSKLSGEYLAGIASRHYGLAVACVRPFSGYGGDQDPSYPIPAIARRVALREDPLVVWGSGQQGRDFVHIEDCIEGMLLAIEKIADGGAVNIGTGRLMTFVEVARLFANLAGYDPVILPQPDKPQGVVCRYADTIRMRTLLGWFPRITVEEGFARVLAEQTEAIRAPAETAVPGPFRAGMIRREPASGRGAAGARARRSHNPS